MAQQNDHKDSLDDHLTMQSLQSSKWELTKNSSRQIVARLGIVVVFLFVLAGAFTFLLELIAEPPPYPYQSPYLYLAIALTLSYPFLFWLNKNRLRGKPQYVIMAQSFICGIIYLIPSFFNQSGLAIPILSWLTFGLVIYFQPRVETALSSWLESQMIAILFRAVLSAVFFFFAYALFWMPYLSGGFLRFLYYDEVAVNLFQPVPGGFRISLILGLSNSLTYSFLALKLGSVVDGSEIKRKRARFKILLLILVLPILVSLYWMMRNKLLIWSVRDNDAKSVRLHLALGANPDVTYAQESSLHHAAMENRLDIVALLLSHGADVNVRNRNEDTPLMFASMYGHKDIVKTLIDKGADVNETGQFGLTALIYAALGGYFDIMQLLEESGAKKTAACDMTPLVWAAAEGDIDAIRALLESGADVNARPTIYFGETPLRIAILNDHPEAVGFLIDNGAKVDSEALRTAASKAGISVIKVLLQKGINMDGADSRGATALTYATQGGQLETVQFLLDSGANVDAFGVSPLCEAAAKGHVDTMRLLIAHHANVNAFSNDLGRIDRVTPLMRAAEEGQIEAVKVLLENGANVNATSILGRNAMAYALENNHKEVIELLREAMEKK